MVEDNEGDILLTSEALQESKLHIDLSVVRDGKEAIDFVTAAGKYSHVEVPVMVLLDVNLPKKNGYEVLSYLKENEKFKHIPVIMLTTSSSDKDIAFCYNNSANYFMTKPVEADDFSVLVDAVENLWRSLNK